MSDQKFNISRRTFLKGSAASIAAALAASGPGKIFAEGVFPPRVIRQSDTVVLAVQNFAFDAINSVLPDFQSSTGLTVALEGGPASGSDMLTKYSAAFAAGNSPVDVFSDSDESSPAFMRAGWVIPLNDVLPQATFDDYPDSMKPYIETFLTNDGMQYRLPHSFDVGYFFTRKDLLDAKGLKAPTTWDEMVSVGKEMTDASSNFYATTDALIKPALLFVFVAYLAAQSGGSVFDFDDQTGEALQFLYDMIYTHKIFPEEALNDDYTAQNNLYTGDHIAFMRQWPFFQDVGTALTDWYAPDKMVIELPPAGAAGAKSWIGGWGWSIPTSAPNMDGAKALLTYLTSTDVAPKLAEQQSFLLTPRKSILDAMQGQDNPIINAMQRYSDANVFAARPFNPRVAEAESVVDDMASLFLTKQATLSDVLKQGKEQIAALSS